MDERAIWQAERNQVIRAQRIAREEAEEAREAGARQADREASLDAAVHARRLTGEPVPSRGDILARAREAAEADSPGRDQGASYGSASRPAMFVTAADGAMVEMTARPPAGVQRSASQAQDDHLLRQAKRLSEDPFMKVEVARFHAVRRAAASKARDAARGVSRSAVPDPGVWQEPYCRGCGALAGWCRCQVISR